MTTIRHLASRRMTLFCPLVAGVPRVFLALPNNKIAINGAGGRRMTRFTKYSLLALAIISVGWAVAQMMPR
jgi:hypothetical protein